MMGGKNIQIPKLAKWEEPKNRMHCLMNSKSHWKITWSEIWTRIYLYQSNRRNSRSLKSTFLSHWLVSSKTGTIFYLFLWVLTFHFSELSLAKLTVKCLEYLKAQLSNEKEYSQISECLSKSLDLQQLILRNAERRSYGVRDFANTIYECEAHQALWFWEMANTSHFPT